jgi:hypothetical protein
MSKYCLTYEAKDPQATDYDLLISEIAKVIRDNSGYELSNPVAGTILFQDNADRTMIGQWNDLFLKNIKNDVFYYLCQIAGTRQGEYFERNEGDFQLDEDFQDILDDMNEE